MDTGTKISGVAHILLLGWAFFGGAFQSEPLPFEVREVSVITAEEYAALVAPRKAETPEPEQVPVAEPDSEPARIPEREPDPAPEPEVAEPPPEPEIAEPEPRPEPEPDPVPTEPVVAVLPQSAGSRPKPRPADRVEPDPVDEPPPDVREDEIERPEVSEEPGEQTVEEPEVASAPKEATDVIEPETDDTTELAPTASKRPPRNRPAPPVRTAEAEPKETEATSSPEQQDTGSDLSDTVNDALREAMAGAEQIDDAPKGPPMTFGEKEALRVGVQKCWNIGPLSTEAQRMTVVVGVSLDRNGVPNSGTIKLLSSSNGSDAAAKQAFEAARRAIIRCGTKGYDLPAEKYAQWRDIEMTFRPEGMGIE